MGQKRYQPSRSKRQAVVSLDTIERGIGVSDVFISDDLKTIILPILGISEAHAAALILSLAKGARLILDLLAGRVEVYYGASLLGWLGGDTDIVAEHLQSSKSLACTLYDIGGSFSEPTATVAINL